VRRAFAVARSATTSIPIDDPPKRGFKMYGPENGTDVVSAFSRARGRLGRPAAATTALKAHLSMPRAAPATLGPV